MYLLRFYNANGRIVCADKLKMSQLQQGSGNNGAGPFTGLENRCGEVKISREDAVQQFKPLFIFREVILKCVRGKFPPRGR